jgi:hypothetical protein
MITIFYLKQDDYKGYWSFVSEAAVITQTLREELYDPIWILCAN